MNHLRTLLVQLQFKPLIIAFVNNQLPLPVSGLLRLVGTARLIFNRFHVAEIVVNV